MTVTLPPHRDVTLVLCLPDGSLLGALAPFRVDVPWWQEAGPVVAAARAAYGVEVTILRLLRAEAGRATRGGPVSYLAEIEQRPAAALVPWPGDPMADEPLRVHYARPGGPGNDVRWADSALAERGTPRTGPAEQVKTWNLSSLWRLPIGSSVAWLKAVPPFFAHESRVLTLLDAAVVPALVAADGPRMLLEDIPGVDQHHAVGAPTLVMVRLLVGLQVAWVARSDELLALGLPDWRAEPLAEAAADVVARTAPELEREVVQQLERLLDGFAQRSSEVESCGAARAPRLGRLRRRSSAARSGRLPRVPAAE